MDFCIAETPIRTFLNYDFLQAQPLPPHMVSVALTSTQQQRPLRPNSKDGLRADVSYFFVFDFFL